MDFYDKSKEIITIKILVMLSMFWAHRSSKPQDSPSVTNLGKFTPRLVVVVVYTANTLSVTSSGSSSILGLFLLLIDELKKIENLCFSIASYLNIYSNNESEY